MKAKPGLRLLLPKPDNRTKLLVTGQIFAFAIFVTKESDTGSHESDSVWLVLRF